MLSKKRPHLYSRVQSGESTDKKICNKFKKGECLGPCDENGLQPVENFYKNIKAPDGLFHRCKACESYRRSQEKEGESRNRGNGKRRKFTPEAKAKMAERWRKEKAADPKLTNKVIAKREDLDASSVSKWLKEF